MTKKQMTVQATPDIFTQGNQVRQIKLKLRVIMKWPDMVHLQKLCPATHRTRSVLL